MTTNQIEQIKTNANIAFEKKEYNQVFSILEKLHISDFITFSEKKGWLHKGPASRYFWNTFILQENIFQACFSSQNPVELLHNYYSKTTIFNEAFEIKLAKEYPSIFVEAIRKNEVFFNKNRINFLLKDNLLTEKYLIHQDVWESFQTQELNLWKEIKSTIFEIEKHPLERILFFTISYFETNNFEANFDFINQAILADIYSFFIDLILKNENIKQENISSEQFSVDFTHNIYENKYYELKNSVFKCLNLIKDRQTVSSRFFQPYCYNSKFQPKYIYESLYFYESPESYYQWHIDEVRYKVSELAYNIKGNTIVEKQLKNGTVTTNKRKENSLNNNILASKLQATIETLKDLKLNYFYFKDTQNKDIQIEIEKIIPPLFCYAFNKYISYYEEIKGANSPIINNWQKAHACISTTNKKSLNVPFIYKTKKEYLNKNADNRFTNEINSQILNIFSYNRPKKLPKFDRFNIKYSVNETPFLILGDYIFSPILFFINFSSQHVYVNSLLNNKKNRDNAIEIENILKDLLIKHNFKVKHTTKTEVNLIDGDADLIIYNKDHVLLMQLKRTNLRLDYKAQYNELINIDLKGSKQLNSAEKHLNKENPIFEIGNRKVTKWIVSNSFEKVNTKINDCLKVNYLDIVSSLNNDEEMTFNTLSSFISFFETDTYFKRIAKPLIENDSLIKNMLSLTNIEKRNFLFQDNNLLKAKKYRHFYYKGLELNKKGKHKDAIKALKKCLDLENNDFEVHGNIANIYADLKNYEKAFFYFKEALKIVPNEPLTKKNYAIALQESGNSNYMKIYSEIVKTFPLLDLTE